MKKILLTFLALTFLAPTFLAPTFQFNSAVSANDDHHPIVPGFERFVEIEEVTDIERGNLLLNELNCMSCHESKSQWSVDAKQAPILTEVGTRVVPEHFESFLLDPHGTKPGTTMPDVLSGKPEAERKAIAESIAHFLASTGKAIRQTSGSEFVSQGEILFHKIGCVACHDPQNEDVTIATSIPLGDLGKKYTLSGLTKFVQNPLHVRPSGRMPQFSLTGQEAQMIATYLLRDTIVESKINFAYYEGTWEKLPNFEQLKPVKTGTASGFDVTAGLKRDNFGMVFTGYWTF